MRRLMLLLGVLAMVMGSAYAIDIQTWQEQELEKVQDAVPDSLKGSLTDIDLVSVSEVWEGLGAVFSEAVSQGEGAIRTAARTMLRMLAIVILCKLMGQICREHGVPAIRLVGALSVTAAAATDMRTLLGLGGQVLEQVNDFTTVLLPVLASASAASGAITGSGVYYSLTVAFSDILIRVCKTCLFPLVYCFVAMAAFDSALGGSRLKKLRELLGWVISVGLKLLVGSYTAFLAVTGLLTGASDSLAMKTAKLSFSALIPVVGSILSDASDTLLAGAGILRSAAGTYGMLVVLGIFAVPFVTIAISFVSFKVTGALAGVLESEQSGLLEAISGAMGYVLAMVSSCVFISILSCCCFMKVVQVH